MIGRRFVRRGSGAQSREGDGVCFARRSERCESYELLRNGRREFRRGIDPRANVRLEHLRCYQRGED